MADEELNRLRIDKTALNAVRKRRFRVVFPLLLLFALAAIGLWFKLRSAVSVETVTVSQVYPSQGFTLLNASGYVVAQRKAALAAKLTGRLEWLGVEEGSRVRKGDVLARLESADVSAARSQAVAAVESARSSLEQARAEYRDASQSFARQKELLHHGVASRADYDAAEARFRRTRAAVSGAEWNEKGARSSLRGAQVALDYTLIRAPFDAVVLTKNADVGDIVTPLGAAANAKASVVTIADMSSLQVEVDVSESNLALVKVGQPCEIRLDALPERRFNGVVHTVVPTADRSKASVLVKVRFVERIDKVLPEMSAKVAFLERPVKSGENRPRIAVNPAAVVSRGGRQVLFVVKGDQVVETEIRSAGRIGDMLELLSGVSNGEKVVLQPPERLKNGSRVRVGGKK